MIHVYSTVSIIYTRIFKNNHRTSIFSKNICSDSILGVEGVFEVGVNTNVGMNSTDAGGQVQTFLKEIIGIGKNLF